VIPTSVSSDVDLLFYMGPYVTFQEAGDAVGQTKTMTSKVCTSKCHYFSTYAYSDARRNLQFSDDPTGTYSLTYDGTEVLSGNTSEFFEFDSPVWESTPGCSLGFGSRPPTRSPTKAPTPTSAPTSAPVSAPTSTGGGDSDDDGGACFSGNMEVVVQGKGVVPMEALQVGDYVKVSNGEAFEQVYAFGHRVPQKYTEFVQLHTNAGTPLEMTGEHLVFVHGKTNPVRADSIEVGDLLQAVDNDAAVVEKIDVVTRNGIYNPLTRSGTIQVNGIVASNYISFQKENNEYAVLQGGVEIMSHHDAAHVAMTPYRFYCTTLAICDVNDAKNSDGMPFYVSMGIELIEWSKQQHIFVQLFIYASFRMLLLASILMTYAVFMIPAYLLSSSLIFQMQRVISNISTIGVGLNKGLKMKKQN